MRPTPTISQNKGQPLIKDTLKNNGREVYIHPDNKWMNRIKNDAGTWYPKIIQRGCLECGQYDNIITGK